MMDADRNGLTSDLAEALYQARMMLPQPARAGGKVERPLFKIPPAALGYLRAIELALRSSLHRLGENPGTTMEEVDAIKLRMMGLGERACAAAPRPEQDEAAHRVAELEAQLAEVRGELEVERRAKRTAEAQAVDWKGRYLSAMRLEEEAPYTMDELLDMAGEESGSDNVWRELGRFAEFCARITLAGEMESTLLPGKAIPPVIPDDPDLPVAPWVRAEGRSPPATVLEAAELYLGWTKAISAKWREQRGLPSTT